MLRRAIVGFLDDGGFYHFFVVCCRLWWGDVSHGWLKCGETATSDHVGSRLQPNASRRRAESLTRPNQDKGRFCAIMLCFSFYERCLSPTQVRRCSCPEQLAGCCSKYSPGSAVESDKLEALKVKFSRQPSLSRYPSLHYARLHDARVMVSVVGTGSSDRQVDHRTEFRLLK